MIIMRNIESYLKYIIYHELIGLKVDVYSLVLSNKKKISGIIVDETKNMFKINTNKKTLMISKNISLFVFKLNDKYNEISIKINGNQLISRPQNRLKNLKK